MVSPTANKGMTYPAHGGAVNAWDTPLNQNFDQLDLNLGGVYQITISSTIVGLTLGTSQTTASATVATITLLSSLAQNTVYLVTGTLGSTVTLVMPAVGSMYIVDNEATTGSFSFKVNTVGGSSALTVPQGTAQLLYTSSVSSNSVVSEGTVPQAKLYTYLGTPQGNISGIAGAANGSLTDVVWDTTNQQFYVCTLTGSSTTANVWTPTHPRVVPEGYLTLSTDPNNPILTADAASKTAVYYTPFMGGFTLLSNGTALYPYQFSQLQLVLTAAQAANGIYDVFIYNSTAGPMIGTGPAWTNSGAGTGTRGAGAGTTQLARLNGVWTNAVQANLLNGSTTFVCPVNQGVYIGSIAMDAAAGQVTCHRSFGQNRKFGVWNNYNRQKIMLKVGDPSTGWSYAGTAVRISNASTGNSLQVLTGLSEEEFDISFVQNLSRIGSGNAQTGAIGVGFNSTNTFSGFTGTLTWQSSIANTGGSAQIARYITSPSLGMQQVYSLEQTTAAFSFTGQEVGMVLSAVWNG